MFLLLFHSFSLIVTKTRKCNLFNLPQSLVPGTAQYSVTQTVSYSKEQQLVLAVFKPTIHQPSILGFQARHGIYYTSLHYTIVLFIFILELRNIFPDSFIDSLSVCNF